MPFGFSACYHAENAAELTSPEFLGNLLEAGCLFGWYFPFAPLDHDPQSVEARRGLEHTKEPIGNRLRSLRELSPISLVDIGEDAQFTHDGSTAGADTQPAEGEDAPLLLHYMNSSARQLTLLESVEVAAASSRGISAVPERLLPYCPLRGTTDMMKQTVCASLLSRASTV